ncbi:MULTISPECIES: hypothetical protein [Pseudoalteromonas]|uniref:hypothetical protein n=1 Tax=Pseudoalteromonas TaxID=53246 RepID=UPI0015838895|nr:MULTISPECIES: hypothetical protein [Pseudoalteromonas]MDI4650769.1 hypothetical protein [Pseudoalteromonas shioyasakiensis]NUJ37190.1 hypothetical protein [Pseudoalteromonas sp. 0303]
MFKLNLKPCVWLILFVCSNFVFANDFKLMVVDDNASSKAIMQGNFANSLETMKEANNYIVPFNRCVAGVKLKQFAKAEQDCSQAIAMLKKVNAPHYKRNELTSYALSNRGIARLMAKNDTAAIADFYEAVQLNNYELVSFNLNLAKQELKLW